MLSATIPTRSGTASVSAIVPNYNHGSLLPEAILALQAQTRPPVEIIIVDDASTDDSRRVVASLQRDNPEIRAIYHSQRRGAIAALNSGIAAASAAYLYLGAADDVTKPRLFERLGATFDAHPTIGLVCAELELLSSGAKSIRPAARPSQATRVFSPSEARELLSHIDNFIMTGACLLRRRALVEAGGLRPDLGSFADGFAVRQLSCRYGFAFVPEVLAQWRVSKSGLSRTTASDPNSIRRLIADARAAFAADPAFPVGYADRFATRWKFGALRLALDEPVPSRDLLMALAPGPNALRRIFVSLVDAPLGRYVALVWATLAYRPMSFLAITHTAVRRSMRRSHA